MALTISSTSFGYHVTGDTSGTITTDKVRALSVIFTPVNGASDAFSLTDGKDRVICKGVGTTQNDSFQVDLYNVPIEGLKLASMSNSADILVVLVS